jgi:hypothetical protein
MNYSTVNGVKDIQVLLKEAGVYTGRIDGVWGKGSRDGIMKMFYDYHLRANGGRTVPLPIVAGSDFAAATQAIKDIQSNLKLFQLYQGAVDGVMGVNTYGGFLNVFSSYRAYQHTPVYGLGWSKKVPASFAARVSEWCKSKGYWPNAASALMGCMHFESGGTFNPAKQNNGGSNYFGLIQFGEAAAKDLGVSLNALKLMTQMEQLEYVFKYFEMWERRGKVFRRLEDFYLTIFYPAAVGKAPDAVLFEKNSPIPLIAKSYLQNNGFDADKNGDITIGEISVRLYQAYYDGMDPANRTVLSAVA